MLSAKLHKAVIAGKLYVREFPEHDLKFYYLPGEAMLSETEQAAYQGDVIVSLRASEMLGLRG